MKKYEIWDGKSDLKGIKADIWLEGYPKATSDKLVLIYSGADEPDTVAFIDELKAWGYIGSTDEETVENYINNIKSSEVEVLKKELEEIKQKSSDRDNELEALKSAIDDILMNDSSVDV